MEKLTPKQRNNFFNTQVSSIELAIDALLKRDDRFDRNRALTGGDDTELTNFRKKLWDAVGEVDKELHVKNKQGHSMLGTLLKQLKTKLRKLGVPV